MKEKIGSIEAIALVMLVMINHIILSFPKVIIGNTGSSSLINIVFISILALIFVNIINVLMKKFPGHNIIKISEFLGGKVLKYITGILFILYFIFIISITMRSFCENIKMIYFRNYSIIFLIILFTLAIVVCNLLGTKSIIRTNLITLPIIVISIIFIFFANLRNFDYSKIFPVLGNGAYATFFSGLSNLYAFSAIMLIYFLPPYLKNQEELRKVSLIAIAFSSILLLFSVASVLFIFAVVENLEQILPLYSVIRFIEFGRFFQRSDAVFLLVWIISSISYLSFVFALLNNTFQELFNLKSLKMIFPSFGLLIFGISLIPKNLVQIRFLESTVYKFLVFGVVFFLGFSILFLASIKQNKRKEGENSNEQVK